MQHFLIALFCIASVWALPFEPVRNVVPFRNSAVRIINGDEATKGQFPWQAAIFVSFPGESNLCGGAVISEEWILTAGHCVYGASSFRIDLGSTLLIGDDPDRMPFTTDQYILHEEYNPSTLANDVAVIRLPKLVTFNDYIKPIALASRELEAGITVTASGWGLTSDGGDGASPNLNFVSLVTISNENCRSIYGGIGDGVVCATGSGNEVQSTCEGDSGGPLVTDASDNPLHVGVVSFGHRDGCESGNPAGFSRTAYYRDWIRDKTGV